MKTIQQRLLALSFVVTMTMITERKVFADLVASVSLGAQSVVDAFNGLNDGKGIYIDFIPHGVGGNYKIINMGDASQFADTSAYCTSHGGEDYFRTFTLEPNAPGYRYTYGKLNYDSTTGISQTVGMSDTGDFVNYSLTVGAAYLYKLYATEGYMLPTEFAKLAAAIRFLVGDMSDIDRGYLGNLLNDPYDWTGVTNNPYLQMLLDLNNDMNYWMSDYNPDAYYTEIGNYSVFVMTTGYKWIDQLYGPDFLYIVGAASPYDSGGPGGVPEPATILLWTLGTLGAMGGSYARRRTRMKKRLA